MIRRDGYVKVLDFGLAILRAREHETQSMLTDGSLETVIAAVAGTPAYMSPEQIDGRALDARSDLFSLGVLLCEMTTGTNPFAGSGVVDTISAIQQTPDPAARLTADLTHDARAIILKLLQRDPADRYQASSELVTDLRRRAGNDRGAGASPGGESRPQTWCCDRGGLALLAAAGIAAVLYRGSERRHWVHEQAIPESCQACRRGQGSRGVSADREAEKYAPGDPDLVAPLPSATRVATVHSTPPGALVEVADYLSRDEQVAPAGESHRSIKFDCQPATCDGRSRSLASASCSRHRWPAT